MNRRTYIRFCSFIFSFSLFLFLFFIFHFFIFFIFFLFSFFFVLFFFLFFFSTYSLSFYLLSLFVIQPRFVKYFHKACRYDTPLRKLDILAGGTSFAAAEGKWQRILSHYKRSNIVLLLEKEEAKLLSMQIINDTSLYTHTHT